MEPPSRVTSHPCVLLWRWFTFGAPVDLHTPGRLGLVSWAIIYLLAGQWVLDCQSVSDCRLPRGRQSEPLTAFHSHSVSASAAGTS